MIKNEDCMKCQKTYRAVFNTILGLIFKKQYVDAMNKCIQSVNAIDAIKDKSGQA